MKEVLVHAKSLAESSPRGPDTAHLLVALTLEHGAAANLLKSQGVQENKLRQAQRAADDRAELPGLVEAVLDKAVQLARQGTERRPTALHLLAALMSVKETKALRIIGELGVDAQKLQSGALRGLHADTRERRGQSSKRAVAHREHEALPLPLSLKELTSQAPARSGVKASVRVSAKAAAKTATAASEAPPPRRAAPPTVRRFIEAGRELENKQRKSRSMRADSQGAQREGEPTEKPSAGPHPDPRAPLSQSAPQPLPAEHFELDAAEYPLLTALGRNLTLEAATGGLEDIVGRGHELERVIDVMNKRRGNTPCLIGQTGVGKTAIVHGLAHLLARGQATALGDRLIVELRPGDLLAGTSLRGALSQRIGELCKELATAKGRVVLFFDDIHALFSAHDGGEAVDELKAALGRGELPCIAATTDREYARQIEADPALSRRFTPVEVPPPSEADALAILGGVVGQYQAHHQVDYTEDALLAAVRLSTRYLTERALPDKAIALLDLAGARARRAEKQRITADDIAAVLAEQIGVPSERLAVSDRERLLRLEDQLARRIVGHDHVLSAIGETLRRNAAGFRSGRPIGSFLFLGPTGVGKTETARALAELLFPGGDAVVRLDMSEFSEAHAVARLIGAPPGYLGHDAGGQLTEAVRRRPYCLVLLDEIEKAHRDVLQTLLQVLDDGRLTDGKGRTVSFANAVVVMTSNLGSNLAEHRRPVGFGASNSTAAVNASLADAVIEGARAALAPELWNRIDEPLVFAPLDRERVSRIAELLLGRVASQLATEHGATLTWDEQALLALIAAGGYDPVLGARPMRRTIQRLVEGPLARLVLRDEVQRGATLAMTGAEQSLEFRVIAPTREGQAS